MDSIQDQNNARIRSIDVQDSSTDSHAATAQRSGLQTDEARKAIVDLSRNSDIRRSQWVVTHKSITGIFAILAFILIFVALAILTFNAL